MTLHADLTSTLEKLDLVAIDVNEGWTIIRRRLFIDLFIKEEPFSSVEVLYHYPTQKIVVRIFGQTTLVKGGTLSDIVQNVFRKKPCFGVWEDLNDTMGGALDLMHVIDHVKKRYYSPQCSVFSEEKYGEDRFDMTPGLCRACKALAPRISECYKPLLEDEPHKWDDVNFHDSSDSSDWIPEEEDIEIDLRPKVQMDVDVEVHEVQEVNAGCDDYELQEEALGTPREVGSSTKLDTPTDLVGKTIAAALNQAVAKGDLSTDPLKGKKKIVLLTRDANGKLVKADPSLLKGKKIVVQKPLVTSKVQWARKVQLVAKGEYKGKERPFADDSHWVKYLYPTGSHTECSECGQKCHNPATLQKHLQRVHYFSWYHCPVCLLWKNQVNDIVNHARDQHHDNGQLLIKCPNCEQDLLSSSLTTHVQRCLKRIYKVSKCPEQRWPGSRIKSLKQCAFCKFTYNTRKDYNKHLSHHPEALLCKNEGCSYITDDERHLDHHTAMKHGRQGDDLLYCDQCAKPFTTRHALSSHIKKEHGSAEEQFKYHCSFCNSSFPSKSRRDIHQNVEHLKQSYPCEICGKTYSLQSTVRKHVETVHADKESKEKTKMQCSICGKWLSCEYTLKSHMRTHTGEKPYKCNFCDESFVSATWMGIHRRKMHPVQWQEEVKRRQEKSVLKRKHNDHAERLGEAQSNHDTTQDTSQSNIDSQSRQDFGFQGWS